MQTTGSFGWHFYYDEEAPSYCYYIVATLTNRSGAWNLKGITTESGMDRFTWTKDENIAKTFQELTHSEDVQSLLKARGINYNIVRVEASMNGIQHTILGDI